MLQAYLAERAGFSIQPQELELLFRRPRPKRMHDAGSQFACDRKWGQL
jgi:hypothetical protein